MLICYMASTVKRRPGKRKKSKSSKGWFRTHAKRIFYYLFLAGFLTVSLVSVSYVIFFRTAFADDKVNISGVQIVFEEPDPPAHQDAEELSFSKEITDARENKPRVSIIIDDIGYHKKIDTRLLNAPIELTYSFLPFAPYTRELQEKAWQMGKVVMLHLPMEPKDLFWDPGPGALHLADNEAELVEKISQCFAEIPRAVGVNNHMGSAFSEYETGMRVVLEEVAKRNQFYIDSYTTKDSVGLKMAREMGLKSARRKVFLDNVQNVEEICQKMEELVVLAEKEGKSIGIGHPHNATAQAVEECYSRYTDRVDFVDVQDVL